MCRGSRLRRDLTGALPCEDICLRPRTLATEDPCCDGPVEVAVLTGSQVLFRAEACRHVPPQCANTHGHGRMDAHLRVLPGSPPELLLVEGGCEARALMHGYVPPGVAAWTGCRHTRYRWNGQRFVAQPEHGLQQRLNCGELHQGQLVDKRVDLGAGAIATRFGRPATLGSRQSLGRVHPDIRFGIAEVSDYRIL